MPFYIRKSFRAGPFRLNLSKSGLGVSAGVKGLRVGAGPRGKYLHAGRGGLYYRTSLGGSTKRGSAGQAPVPPVADARGMSPVASGDIRLMRDAKASALLDEINEKYARASLGKIVGWAGLALGALALAAGYGPALIVWLLTIPAWLLAREIDRRGRTTSLAYGLEGEAQAAYAKLAAAFDAMRASAGQWRISAGGPVNDLGDWKRNAGATHIVSRGPAALSYDLPKLLTSDVRPPSIQLGGQTLHFFPDVLMVVRGNRVGAIGYGDLDLRWQTSDFIEEGPPPADAMVVGHTWKHPNKNGGPDRRFRDNRQIPICRYEILHLKSASGLNELLEFSRAGVCAPFVAAVSVLGGVQSQGRLPGPSAP